MKLYPISSKCLIAIIILFGLSCGESDGGGNCSISCGGIGTGQPFVQNNFPFLSEAECIKKGEEFSKGCRVAYCPPTGDPDDCYEVQ